MNHGTYVRITRNHPHAYAHTQSSNGSRAQSSNKNLEGKYEEKYGITLRR